MEFKKLALLIRVYNELESNKGKHIDIHDIIKNVKDFSDKEEISNHINIMIGKIENIGRDKNDK